MQYYEYFSVLIGGSMQEIQAHCCRWVFKL